MLRFNSSDTSLKLRPVNADEVQTFFCDPKLQCVGDLGSLFWTDDAWKPSKNDEAVKIGKKKATTRNTLNNFEVDAKVRILYEIMQEQMNEAPLNIAITPGTNVTPSGTATQTLQFIRQLINEHQKGLDHALKFDEDFASQSLIPKPIFDALKELETTVDYERRAFSDIELEMLEGNEQLNADVFKALGAKDGQKAFDA